MLSTGRIRQVPDVVDVAVVGATGQIGREVVRILRADGVAVRALARDPERAAAVLPEGTELLPGALEDEEVLARLVDGARSLFVVSSDPALEPAVFEAAARAGVAHVVKSSAMGPGGRPPAPHARAEEVLAAQPVGSTVLRPNAFMQTLRSYLPAVVESGTLALPAGEGASAWVDTRDIAAVAAAALRADPPAGNRIWEVNGPEALTMHEVAEIVSRGTGMTLTYSASDPAEAEERLARRLGPMGGFLVAHYSAVAVGDFARVTDTVPRLTGRPARSLAALVAEDPAAWRPPA